MGSTNSAINTNALQIAYDNYCRLLVIVTQQVVNPTQANIDAIGAAYQTAVGTGSEVGLVTPKENYSLDGVSYDWVGLQSFIVDQLKVLKYMLIAEQGTFILRSRGVM